MSIERLQKIIIHNSISIDNSLTNFEPHMGLHYQIARSYKPDAHFIGSNTIKKGIELYEGAVPQEEKQDFEKQVRNKSLPYWVVIDAHGHLNGLLHLCRRFEFCKDVIVLVSEETPKIYIRYLNERNYAYHIVGKKQVSLKKGLDLLFKKYHAKTILTDTGRILGNLLLNQGLVNEISLLIHPIIVGNESYTIFHNIENKLKLKLIKKEILEKQYIWIVYEVKQRNKKS